MAAQPREEFDIDEATLNEGGLSPWWRYGVIALVVVEFAVLGWIAFSTYGGHVGPPIPGKVVGPDGQVVFTGQTIRDGQGVFLRYGLMDNGTVWGHGAYMGPDFSAEYLHALAMNVRDWLKKRGSGDPVPIPVQDEQVAEVVAKNRYNPTEDTLLYSSVEVATYNSEVKRWAQYLREAERNKGLRAASSPDPEEVRQLVAFFAWSAWASAAHIPGKDYSYTNNFPYDPAAGNGPTMAAVVWSALSLVALLAGTGTILLAFGRFHWLGWHGRRVGEVRLPAGVATPSQRGSLKFLVLAALLFLLQALVGGGTAHYRAEPGGFFGLDLSQIFPSNLLRTWHLQLAIFWIATAYVGGGLFVGSSVGGHEPRRQTLGMNILAAALVVVVVGALVGQWLGLSKLLKPMWFWFGDQGWEYLETGRAWQILLVAAFLLWAFLLVRAVRPALRDPERREMSMLFLVAAFAIPLFYLPALFFGSSTSFTIVDTWRFWIVHLWVEGFFELFATVMVATIFFMLGMVSRKVATRVIYLDTILFLGAGILGTGHHWYWTGQSSFSMAMSATFSAMEVVPLILLTLDASDFVRVTRLHGPHEWTFYFLIAVGVWNFIGAGIFGFLINLPIVSYYEAGTNLTSNHGHAAMMGVFGMLAVAIIVFGLRQSARDEDWPLARRLIKTSFWGLNAGLTLMLLANLFPTGVLQMVDVIQNGYWHARSNAFLGRPEIVRMEWARLPADVIFIVVGVMPLVAAALWIYPRARKAR
jgi:nitric oxide reductase subunit B